VRFRGPLGARRLTKLGPFVSADPAKERIAQIISDAADDADIELSELDEEEKEEIYPVIAESIYPADDTLTNAKQARLEMCLKRRWSNNWIDALSDTIGFEYNELEKLTQQTEACISLTENATTDNPDNLPEALR